MPTEPEPGASHDPAPSTPNPPVEFYWRPGCPYCWSLRRRLTRLGVPLRMRNIWNDTEAAAIVRGAASGNETVPTVGIAGHFLVNPNPDAVVRLVTAVAPGLVADLQQPTSWWRRRRTR